MIDHNAIEPEITESSIEYNTNDIEAIDLKTLTDQYSSIKSTVTRATDKLTEKTTFNGMEEVSEIVANGMNQIHTFLENNKKPSTVSSLKSKALAVIDPNNKWAGKWMDDTKEVLNKEKLKEKTIQDIANQIISGIEQQREDTIGYMESIVEVQTAILESKKQYEQLLPVAEASLAAVVQGTRDELDLKAMVTRLSKSIMQLDSTLTTKITPLLASARVVIKEIDDQLPDIEHDLKYDGSLKIGQQSLSDLVGMTKSVKSMVENASDVIRRDIHETTLESINMIGDVMVDTDRMLKIQQEEQAYMSKVHNAMEQTAAKIHKNHDNMKQIHGNFIEHKVQHTSALLSAGPGLDVN